MTITTFQTFIPSTFLLHLFTAQLSTHYFIAESMVRAKKIVGALRSQWPEPTARISDRLTLFGWQLAEALKVFTGGRLTTLEGEGT